MFSIGILGFIVWSLVVALLYCEVKVINLAICFNSSTLVDTSFLASTVILLVSCIGQVGYVNTKIKSKNFISFTQLAGNRFLSSISETARKKSFKFEVFNNFRKLSGLKPLDYNWLTWFVGFTEGDGAILAIKLPHAVINFSKINTYRSIRIVLTQKEGKILYDIRDMLGFGDIKYYPAGKNSNDLYRLVVTDIKNIFNLALIFNGNLVLPHRIIQLSSWVLFLKERDLWFYGDCQKVSHSVTPTLKDSWLSGFTEAEGCFKVNITARFNTVTGFRVRPRFLLDQKDAYEILLIIRNLFGLGRVTLRGKTNKVYRCSVDSFKSLILVRDYFFTLPLKTKKAKSFEN